MAWSIPGSAPTQCKGGEVSYTRKPDGRQPLPQYGLPREFSVLARIGSGRRAFMNRYALAENHHVYEVTNSS